MIYFTLWYLIGIFSLLIACRFKWDKMKDSIAEGLAVALFGPILLIVILLDFCVDLKHK